MIVEETRSNWLGTALSLFGAVVVGYLSVTQFVTGYITGWVFAAAIVSTVAWIATGDWVRRRLPVQAVTAAAVVMVLFGAVGAAPSNSLLIVPAAVGLLRLVSERHVAVWFVSMVALAAAVLVALGSLTVDMTPLGLLSIEGGLALGLLGGFNRRQSRAARESERELVESTIVAREEHARASALEARQSMARDIHDVLAHSLGGIVVQLDAVEALIESGRTPEAEQRVRDARALAASGLGEARRAVDALREPAAGPAEQTDVDELVPSLRELISAHESIGGSAAFENVGSAPPTVPSALALALRRTVQESLSNARKHAQGAAVVAELAWHDDGVTLTVSNPLAPTRRVSVRSTSVDRSLADTPLAVRQLAGVSLAGTGGGNGLRGMAERFAALPGGSVTAGVRDDCFVVEAKASLS